MFVGKRGQEWYKEAKGSEEGKEHLSQETKTEHVHVACGVGMCLMYCTPLFCTFLSLLSHPCQKTHQRRLQHCCLCVFHKWFVNSLRVDKVRLQLVISLPVGAVKTGWGHMPALREGRRVGEG